MIIVVEYLAREIKRRTNHNVRISFLHLIALVIQEQWNKKISIATLW